MHQKLEAIQMSFHKWMGKQIVGTQQTCFKDTKDQTIGTQKWDRNRVGESQMHDAEWKKPGSKDDILDDSICMTV